MCLQCGVMSCSIIACVLARSSLIWGPSSWEAVAVSLCLSSLEMGVTSLVSPLIGSVEGMVLGGGSSPMSMNGIFARRIL